MMHGQISNVQKMCNIVFSAGQKENVTTCVFLRWCTVYINCWCKQPE